MRRTAILLSGGVLLIGALVSWKIRHSGGSPVAAIVDDAGSTPAAPQPGATGSPAPREAAERMRRQMEELSRSYHPPRLVEPSSPERRRGETEDDYTTRRRALADYQRFLSMGPVPPEKDQAVRRLILDAQDNWQLALKATGRTQPGPTVNIMMDPVLGPVLQTIEADFRRDVRPVLGDSEGAMLQSMVPSLLPYLQTRAFEGR